MWSSCCWYTIFWDAYTYSTRYLLLTITVVLISILSIWIYEKPQFYKLIFKRSKHSNIVTPIEINQVLETSELNPETLNSQVDKKIITEAEPDSECTKCELHTYQFC